MNKVKPLLKKFEMRRNLPTALQYGAVVSASIIKSGGRSTNPCKTEPTRALMGAQ